MLVALGGHQPDGVMASLRGAYMIPVGSCFNPVEGRVSISLGTCSAGRWTVVEETLLAMVRAGAGFTAQRHVLSLVLVILVILVNYVRKQSGYNVPGDTEGKGKSKLRRGSFLPYPVCFTVNNTIILSGRKCSTEFLEALLVVITLSVN